MPVVKVNSANAFGLTHRHRRLNQHYQDPVSSHQTLFCAVPLDILVSVTSGHWFLFSNCPTASAHV